jgi:3-hydroxyacyl-[acyl-carrier-protein] dehydratase
METEQKFLDDLYFINSFHSPSVNKLTIQVEIRRSHEIFSGHFPGNPVLPGAVTIQIIKELVSEHLGQKIILARASNIKFLSFLNPENNEVIDFDIDLTEPDKGVISCNATIHHENTVFCTFRGEFRKFATSSA